MAEIELKAKKGSLVIDDKEADALVEQVVDFLNASGKTYSLVEGEFIAFQGVTPKVSYKKGKIQ